MLVGHRRSSGTEEKGKRFDLTLVWSKILQRFSHFQEISGRKTIRNRVKGGQTFNFVEVRHLWGLKSLSRGQRANTGRLVAQIPAKLIPCQGGRIRCCSFYLEECKIYLTLSLLPDHVFWAEKEVAGGAGMRSFLHRFFLKLFTYVTADRCLIV